MLQAKARSNRRLETDLPTETLRTLRLRESVQLVYSRPHATWHSVVITHTVAIEISGISLHRTSPSTSLPAKRNARADMRMVVLARPQIVEGQPHVEMSALDDAAPRRGIIVNASFFSLPSQGQSTEEDNNRWTTTWLHHPTGGNVALASSSNRPAGPSSFAWAHHPVHATWPNPKYSSVSLAASLSLRAGAHTRTSAHTYAFIQSVSWQQTSRRSSHSLCADSLIVVTGSAERALQRPRRATSQQRVQV